LGRPRPGLNVEVTIDPKMEIACRCWIEFAVHHPVRFARIGIDGQADRNCREAAIPVNIKANRPVAM